MQRHCAVCKCGTLIEPPGPTPVLSPVSSPEIRSRSMSTSPLKMSPTSVSRESVSPTRVPPAIARILCNKCNPKPVDYTYEPLISRKVQPPRSGIKRSVSTGMPSNHHKNDDIVLSISAESVHVPRRLFKSLTTIQDTV